MASLFFMGEESGQLVVLPGEITSDDPMSVPTNLTLQYALVDSEGKTRFFAEHPVRLVGVSYTSGFNIKQDDE